MFVTKKTKTKYATALKQNTQQRYMGPGGSLLSLLTGFTLYFRLIAYFVLKMFFFFFLQGNPAGGADMAAWSGAALPPTAGYYSYDHPTLAAYG